MSYSYDKNHHQEPGGEVDVFEEYLKERGLKLTQARRDLLNLIFSNHDHFTADELFDDCRKNEVRVSKATLYRTLTILLDCKLLVDHDFGEGSRYYEHVFGHRHHDHFFCTVCKEIIEFRSEKIEALQHEAASELGFHPVRHTLAIFGVCAGCHETERGRATIAEHKAAELESSKAKAVQSESEA
ncbi:MAG: Fur family transcriptional regulator [Planctomycetota bacterium]